MAETSHTRDIVVIGGSAGGLEVLQTILNRLPADFPATVLAVLHIGPISYLANVLGKSSKFPVQEARNGVRLEHGQVHVGVPGLHLMIHDDHLLLRRGPRENLSRPAVDVLFRSAAASLGGRVIGVVLSGSLSDGTAGLRAIKRCGGLAVVQEPKEAAVPQMPLSALRHVEVDHVCRADAIAPLLETLVRQPAGRSPEVPLDIRLETAIAAQELADMKVDDALGKPSRFTCPECHGALWEIEDGTMLRFRCHVGHAFTADSVLSSQGEEIERMLGTLLRSHQERAALARRLVEKERAEGRLDLAKRLEDRARGYEEDARLVFELMRDGLAGASGATNELEGEDLPEGGHGEARVRAAGRGPAGRG